MSPARLSLLTTLAMLAFAANSLLCRVALLHTDIDGASFTSVRLLSGALMLALILHWRTRPVTAQAVQSKGSWWSALALFAYAAGFSFAYKSLTTATGALLLFGAVQVTMIGHGWWRGERLRPLQSLGLLLAAAGLLALLLPGLSAPPLFGASLMLGAGVAWGVYSVRGKGSGDPTQVTAANFWRATLMALLMSLLFAKTASIDSAGLLYAVASGALASAIGYAIWYTVLPALSVTNAATVQLSVPLLAALAGVIFLGESISLRLAIASAAILGGIALVILQKKMPGHIVNS